MKQGYIQSPTEATKRFCQFLTLNPDTIDEYKYWHESSHIWKEIPFGIKDVGILNMEIYVISNMAFMIVETPIDFDWDKAFGQLATLERQEEWEKFVAPFQLAHNGRSDEKWQLMERIFSLKDALSEM